MRRRPRYIGGDSYNTHLVVCASKRAVHTCRLCGYLMDWPCISIAWVYRSGVSGLEKPETKCARQLQKKNTDCEGDEEVRMMMMHRLRLQIMVSGDEVERSITSLCVLSYPNRTTQCP